MPTKHCFSLVRGRAMRVTRLDGCGVPVPGSDSQVVSDGFVSVALTANTDEGTSISVQNAAGKTCILDEPCPQFTGYGVEVAFCQVDPELYAMMSAQDVVLDQLGDAVGFRMNSDVDACDAGFALEVWSNVPVAACDPAAGGAGTFGYFLLPFLRGGVLGDFTIGNDAVTFTLSGANSKAGSGWAKGPYDVVEQVAGGAGPLLTDILAGDHLHMQLTTIAPPDVTCGAQALGTPATSATAGTPGGYLPSGSYGPKNLAGATGLTASPTTAWATGEYVPLGDGTTMHWDGAAWVAGAAP